MHLLGTIKIVKTIKKYFFVVIFSIAILAAGAFNYSKTKILSENEIPPQLLFTLKNISKDKNIDLFKFAAAIKDRTDFGRIDLTDFADKLTIEIPILNIFKLDLFNTYNIFNFPNFSIKRFFLEIPDNNLYGVMLLSENDIKNYGNLDPYNYENALNMFADKLILENYFTENTLHLVSSDTPSGLPTCCVITQRFGQVYPDSLLNQFKGIIPQYHTGLDIADIPTRITLVHSTMNGKVNVGEDLCGGKYINIINENYKTYYGHLDSFNVHTGQQVESADIIGVQGHTGKCQTGKHTHYEVYEKGKLVNPENFP